MIPCPFCQTLVEKSLNKHNIYVYVCPCSVKFQVKDNKIDSWSFYVTIKQQKFMLMFISKLGNKPEFSIWDSKKEVLRLNVIPNITLDNAEEKVKLYLLFS